MRHIKEKTRQPDEQSATAKLRTLREQTPPPPANVRPTIPPPVTPPGTAQTGTAATVGSLLKKKREKKEE